LVHAVLRADSGASLSVVAFLAISMGLLQYGFGVTTRKDMHYHIRWSDSKLDWKRFSTREEAAQAAKQLARPGERFTLEPADNETCMQTVCKRMLGTIELQR
jgi:hypothetical protein